MGMAGFVQQVAKFAQREGLLREGMGIVVACSGGPDSLALAEVLHVLTPRYRLRLCVAHFEHGIRGAASLADAQFVRDYCAQRQLPCIVGSANVPRVAEQAGQSLETMGRELRYAFLERVRKEKGLDELFQDALKAGIKFTTEYQVTDTYIVSVPTPYDKATRFLFGFATNQIFFDGNKRIAVNTMLVCLQLYGIIVQYSDEELIQMGLDVANGIMKEDEVIKSLKRHTIRLI